MSRSNNTSQYRMRTTRVLHVGPGYGQRGGIASVLQELAAQRDRFDDRAIAFSFFETRSLKSLTGVLLFFFVDLARFVVSMARADIVHFHTSVRGSFFRKYLLFLLARAAGRKTIFHLHAGNFSAFIDSSAKCIAAAAKHFIGEADAAIAVSTEVSGELLRFGATNDNLFIIGNTSADFESIKERVAKDKVPYIAFAGRLTEAKGVNDALKAIALLKSQGFHVRMKLAGSGDIEHWKRLVRDYDIDDRIQFPGWLEGEAKHAFLSRARAFCMPSHHESFGIATLEAMYARLPVIGTRLGGFMDLVEEGKTGYLVEAGDIDMLAQRIRALMESPELASRMGAAGHARAHERYSTEATIAKYVECYRRVAETSR